MCGESMDTTESETYNFQMWESVLLTSYYYRAWTHVIFQKDDYCFELRSLGCWRCLEAADNTGQRPISCYLLVLVMQQLSNSKWHQVHSSNTFCIIMNSQIWRCSMCWNPLQLPLFDTQSVHILASGCQFKLSRVFNIALVVYDSFHAC